jgi:hypothetical protein
MMSNFFPMSRGDLWFVVALLAFSFVSFLPWSRSINWGGMALLGWLMALLMVLSPTIALLRIMAERKRVGDAPRGQP